MTSGQVKRFTVSDRIEHWVLTLSFGLLALTGIVQSQAETGLATWIIGLLGGIEASRWLHRLAAIILMLQTIYHLGVLGYKVFVLRVPMSMLPGVQDVRNFIQWVRYNLGLSGTRPLEGRYTAAEKLEYWAVAWGAVVMGITGFMLWNPIATTHLLPGDFVPAARAAHGLEAVLAVLAIIIWHVYHVHIRHLSKSMFTGKLSVEEMEDEHPAELAEIQTGKVFIPPSQEVIAQRRKVFVSVYGLLAVLMLAGVYFFVAFEKTAIATIPPAQQVEAFAPLTPTPLPTLPALPTLEPEALTAAAGGGATISWEGDIAPLMAERCVSCHSQALKLGELDLSSYEATMAGGHSGPAVVPGEVQTSLLVSRQASGGHPGQFSQEELQQVVHWIETGALAQ